MINIYCWNARGLGISNKRLFLKDSLSVKQIDIVCIQEAKKESFQPKILNALSTNITQWFIKSSIGSSGGLLLGINESKFWLIDYWINPFSITVHLKNKSNNVEWLFTTVYGPVLSHLRVDFLNEIRSIALLGPSAWLICGDFNLIRSRSEKQGPTYNFVLSSRFNSLIASLELVELPLLDRKFTLFRSPSSPSKALLDRFLYTSDWLSLFPAAIVHSLPRCYSQPLNS